ncbi:MAG: NupC/NupG family nucleoside CNT transporter [Acidobacteria bacterium]|nr:NupC/NupG family nucleoside CNT transporter [Acidobacteriota bacterium]
MARLQPVLGLLLIGLVAYAWSSNRRAIRLRAIAWGMGLQFLFALIVLRTSAGQAVLEVIGDRIRRLLGYSMVGSSFVFGPIGDQPVWQRLMTAALGPDGAQYGTIFAFQIAPAIIFVAALFAVLYHLGLMQIVVGLFAVVMHRLLGTSGAESVNVAASLFMGQSEAPLTIRPYLARATVSELMTIMTSGMAHISGALMVAYIAFGMEPRHLLTAVIMTAPGTIVLAKMFVPETGRPDTLGTVRLGRISNDVNVIDAAGRGSSEGLWLALNVVAMLISFVALVALANALLGWAGGFVGRPDFSLQLVFGWLLAPVAWCLGVPWRDAPVIGNLLGTRMVLNEFIAYAQLGPLKASLDPRSFTVATFALCGFANIGSIGIQIGGIGSLIPDRRQELALLGVRAMIAGTLANFASACIAAILL